VRGLARDRVVTDVMLARQPLRRFVAPAEVAAAVAFLISPAAAPITGACLALDGGWMAT
jgi:3-hydroxybutyrate dehydrogenase